MKVGRRRRIELVVEKPGIEMLLPRLPSVPVVAALPIELHFPLRIEPVLLRSRLISHPFPLPLHPSLGRRLPDRIRLPGKNPGRRRLRRRRQRYGSDQLEMLPLHPAQFGHLRRREADPSRSRSRRW